MVNEWAMSMVIYNIESLNLFLGFTLNSLSLIHGMRSTTRADRNLMHFVVETVEKKFPDLLRLKRELTTVHEASKFK